MSGGESGEIRGRLAVVPGVQGDDAVDDMLSYLRDSLQGASNDTVVVEVRLTWLDVLDPLSFLISMYHPMLGYCVCWTKHDNDGQPLQYRKC